MQSSTLRCIAVAAAAGMALWGADARALEAANPYLNGVNIGIPIAAIPPPGIYINATNFAKPEDVYNGSGDKTGIRTSVYGTTLAGIYVPGWHILGADYLAFIRQPIVGSVTKAFGETNSNAGGFNTIISPFNLGWHLGNGMFVSTGIAFYLPDGVYSPRNAVNIANNYATFEPSAAFSYLHNGLNLTVFADYDINTTNNNSSNRAAIPTGHYHSGDTFNADFTATQDIGLFKVGAGAYLLKQTTDDTAGGQVVGASPFNSRGNRATNFAIGPVAGYRVGPVEFLAYYTRDLVKENSIGGDSFFLRIGTRF